MRRLMLFGKVPLVMRHNYLDDLVFGERDVLTTSNFCDSSFNNYGLIESGAIFKNYADHLIAHACFGMGRKLRNPFPRKPNHC
jgi:hypothetical protein